MEQAIDLKREYLAAKIKESPVGFAGFGLTVLGTAQPAQVLDGNLILSSWKRKDGSGYLSLTFVIDAEGDPSLHSAVSLLFEGIRKKGCFAGPGMQFDVMMEAPIDLELSRAWFMDTFTFYSDSVTRLSEQVVERALLPAFEAFLPIRFGPMEWLPKDQGVPVPAPGVSTGCSNPPSISERIRNWLRSKSGGG